MTGITSSPDFPTTPNAFDVTYNDSSSPQPNGGDVFVARLNVTGSALEYATFLGGRNNDTAEGVTISSAGQVYVTGYTYSSDFPTTAGAYDTVYNSQDALSQDAFVVRLDARGSALEYSTFLGGMHGDLGRSIAVDAVGRAYVTGQTHSYDFPVTSGAFCVSHNGGYIDAFVARLSSTGSKLEYATFLGGRKEEATYSIAVDFTGRAYVTGDTMSDNFPTTSDAFDTVRNPSHADAFVAQLNEAGSALEYGTFLGAGSWDAGYGIAIGVTGRVYVAGFTYSGDFPTTPGAFDSTHNSALLTYADAFVSKLAMGQTQPVDAAALSAQSEHLSVRPGSPVSGWIEVLNAGETIWTAAEYGYIGKDALEGQTTALTHDVAPGQTYTVTWNLTVPQALGMYDYGFRLRRGSVEFGPLFFVRVTVLPEPDVYLPLVFRSEQ